MTNDTRRILEVLTYAFLLPVALIAMEITPGWSLLKLNILPIVGYMLACVCGVLSGFCGGRIYGHRYYLVFMAGQVVAAVGGLATAQLTLCNVNNVSYRLLLLVTLVGTLPGIGLSRILKKIQDMMHPRTKEEIATHEHIEAAQEQEKSAYLEDLQSTRNEIMSVLLCFLAIIPPLGLLVNYFVYRKSEGKPAHVRRHAMFGMWFSGIFLAIILAVAAYAYYLDNHFPDAAPLKAHRVPARAEK
jgi:hypothetical protein